MKIVSAPFLNNMQFFHAGRLFARRFIRYQKDRLPVLDHRKDQLPL